MIGFNSHKHKAYYNRIPYKIYELFINRVIRVCKIHIYFYLCLELSWTLLDPADNDFFLFVWYKNGITLKSILSEYTDIEW